MGKKIYLTVIWTVALLAVVFSVGIRFCGWFAPGKSTSSKNITNVASGSLSDTVTVDEYKNLTVEVGFGEVSFASSNDDTFSVQYQTTKEKFVPQIGVSKDTLYILQEDLKFNDFSANSNKLTVTIYTPAGFEFGNVHIESGAGDLDVDNLTAEKLDLDYGAGDIKIKNSAIDAIDVDAGAGDVVMTDNAFEKIDVDAGAGDVKISGVGDIDQYDFDIDVGVGDIKVGDNKSHGEFKASGNSGKKISVDCGVGDLEIIQ